jgi:hypothetical protein
MRRAYYLLTAMALGLSLMLWGCAPWPNLQRDYGRSVHNNLAQQLVHPQAGLQGEHPAVGLPPKAGEAEMERYDKSFKGEEKVSPYMGITTGGK